jgi:alpha-1,2-glucosyltransferase
MTSLLASMVNVFLIYNIRAEILGTKQKLGKNSQFQIVHCIETLSIALLPPMYFFAHLYYTDVLAITTVLGMMLAALREQHQAAAIFGAASVGMRQTNIVWVGMFFGIAVLNAVVRSTNEYLKHDKKKKKLCVKNNYGFKVVFCRQFNGFSSF